MRGRGAPQEYFRDFVRTFCISAINQFVFLGDPSDLGKGEFVPMGFALFVVSMAELDCTVNVFFDETILPNENTVRATLPALGTGTARCCCHRDKPGCALPVTRCPVVACRP